MILKPILSGLSNVKSCLQESTTIQSFPIVRPKTAVCSLPDLCWEPDWFLWTSCRRTDIVGSLGQFETAESRRNLGTRLKYLKLQDVILSFSNVQITIMHKVWKYEMFTVYDPSTKISGLFVEYIQVPASQTKGGWMAVLGQDVGGQGSIYSRIWGKIRNLFASVGNWKEWRLLMLKSFWGKFGHRNSLSQTEQISDPDMFYAWWTT